MRTRSEKRPCHHCGKSRACALDDSGEHTCGRAPCPAAVARIPRFVEADASGPDLVDLFGVAS